MTKSLRICIASGFLAITLCALTARGQSPGFYDLPPSDPYQSAGLGMWGVSPSPHLVIRAPLSQHAHRKHAVIPHASKQPVWKQPYSYGYFGAKGHRFPYRSFGHQQAYTEWRWR